MAIPTICETDLIEKIMSQIRVGKKEETIVEEMKNPISVMTINMKSPSLQDANDQQQKKLLSFIFRLYPSAIIFCREPPENFKDVVASAGASFSLNETATTVVWAAGQFKEEKLKPKDSKKMLDETLDTMKKDEHVRSRLSMVKLTTKTKPPHSTLAVSYHGPHRKEKCYKFDLSSHLLRFLTKVKKEEKDIQSFIVGGDFNLNTTELDLSEFSGLVSEVPEYPLTARAKKNKDSIRRKDNFIWSTNITVGSVKALKCGNKYAAFDHDPVEGKLVLKLEDATEPVPASSPTR